MELGCGSSFRSWKRTTHPTLPLLWQCSSPCVIPTKRRKLKLAGTLLCAVLPATEAVSIPQLRFLHVDWCEDARGARVRIFILTGLLQLAAFSFRTIKYWSGFAGDF